MRKKYEYKITATVNHSGHPDDRGKERGFFVEELNAEGQEGWELHTLKVMGEIFHPQEAHMVWKREVIE